MAQTHVADVVQLGFRQTPLLQIILLGQSLLYVQVLLHCGTGEGLTVGVGLGVGLAVGQTQLLDVVQLGFRHDPLLQVIPLGQSAEFTQMDPQ